jgi:hypothetical protein
VVTIHRMFGWLLMPYEFRGRSGKK